MHPNNWQFLKHYGFKKLLTVLFTVAMLVFAFSGASIINWLQGQKDTQVFIEQGRQITKNFAQQSTLALLSGIGKNAEKAANLSLEFPDVLQVSIFDTTHTPLLHKGQTTDWHPEYLPDDLILHEAKLEHETDKAWHFVSSVNQRIENDEIASPFDLQDIGPQSVGFVHVSINKKRYKEQQQKRFNDIFVSTFTFAFIIWLLLLWFTNRLINPLAKLSELMHEAETGALKVRSAMDGPKEVAEMSRAFNKMMSVLEQRADELDKQNALLIDEMEQKVQAEKEREQLQKRLVQAQKMEAVGQLTGGIAHDFNNILASIMGYTELAIEKIPEDEKLEKYLREVYHAGGRARDLVKQMLAFSRGDACELRPYQLEPLIKEVKEMMRSTLPSTIKFNSEFETDLPLLMVDPVQIHQIILNLCINARDAISNCGEIHIQLKQVARTTSVCVSCHQDINGEFVALEISDTGEGIKPEVVNRIFEPFYTTKEVGKGSGMGLSMVHGIMHKFNGHMLLETKPGHGTKFVLLFPVAKDSLNAA